MISLVYWFALKAQDLSCQHVTDGTLEVPPFPLFISRTEALHFPQSYQAVKVVPAAVEVTTSADFLGQSQEIKISRLPVFT